MRSIAINTMRSFLRHKMFHIVFLLIFILMLLSLFVGNLALNESPKFVMDFCLFVMEFFVVIIVLFFASQLFYQERKWKTLSIVLTKISSSQYVLWKFLWFVFFLFLLFFVLTCFYIWLSWVAWLFVLGTIWRWSLLALFLMFLKMCVLFSVVFFFSTFLSSISTIFVSLVVYFISHILSFLKFYVHNMVSHSSRFLQYFVDAVYIIFPQFDQLSLKDYLYTPVLWDLNFLYFLGLSISNILFIFLLLFFSIIVYSKCQKHWLEA